MGACCSAPSGAQGQEEVRKAAHNGGAPAASDETPQQAVPTLGLAAAGATAPRGEPPPLSARSMGWYSAVEGAMSDTEDDWHDAASEVDLAEALQEWEEEQRWHDPDVDQAIQVLKTHGHLVSPDIEAAAQDAPGQLAEVADGGARVHVAAVPSGLLKLERSRSQHLHSALAQLPVQEQLAAAAELAAAGRVLGAEAALQRAAEAAGGTLKELEALSTEAVSAVLPAGSSLDVAQVRREAHVVREALCSLEDHSGWMVSRDDKLKVYYRHLKGTTVHSLKFRAVFDHPLEHLLALAHEFDLIPNWNKFSLAALMLAEPSVFESFLYGAQWMMKPFKNMQALLRARGFDLAEEHRCLLVCLEDTSPEDLPEGHTPLPKEWPKRKTVNFLPGSCLKLRPLPPAPDGSPRTEGSLLIHLDPHIPFIPAFLLNFVLGVLAPYIFNQMRRVLDDSFADPAGEYPRRIAAQPHLYGLARARMQEYADVLAAEAATQTSEADEAALAASHKRRRRLRSVAGSTP